MTGQDVGRAFISGFVFGAIPTNNPLMSFAVGAFGELYNQEFVTHEADKCGINWDKVAISGAMSLAANGLGGVTGVAKFGNANSQAELMKRTMLLKSAMASFYNSYFNLAKHYLEGGK